MVCLTSIARCTSSAISLLVLGPAALGQCPLSWAAANSLPGVESAYDCVGWDPDGSGPLPMRLVVTGRVGISGHLRTLGIATFDFAASTWAPLGALDSGESLAIGVAAGPNGTLYMATPGAVRQWLGSAWVTIGAGPMAQYATDIRRLVVLANGAVVVAGNFNAINGVAVANIAKWNGTTWSGLGSGLNGLVTDAIAMQNGNLCAAGLFTVAGGNPINGLAVWNGANWSAVGAGLPSNVDRVTQLTNGDLVANAHVSGSGHAVHRRRGGDDRRVLASQRQQDAHNKTAQLANSKGFACHLARRRRITQDAE